MDSYQGEAQKQEGRLMTAAITFSTRPRVETTKYDFRHRVWRSRCGRYKIVHSVCLLGPREGPEALPPVWYAMKARPGCVDGKCFDIVSKHRVRNAAVRACEVDSKRRIQR